MINNGEWIMINIVWLIMLDNGQWIYWLNWQVDGLNWVTCSIMVNNDSERLNWAYQLVKVTLTGLNWIKITLWCGYYQRNTIVDDSWDWWLMCLSMFLIGRLNNKIYQFKSISIMSVYCILYRWRMEKKSCLSMNRMSAAAIFRCI